MSFPCLTGHSVLTYLCQPIGKYPGTVYLCGYHRRSFCASHRSLVDSCLFVLGHTQASCSRTTMLSGHLESFPALFGPPQMQMRDVLGQATQFSTPSKSLFADERVASRSLRPHSRVL